MEYEQLTIFDYQPPTINFPQLVADGLAEYCKRWEHLDYIEKLKENHGKDFFKIFCKITKTYYVDRTPNEYYSVEFSKDGKATIKRCGRDFHKREPDEIIDIQSVVDVLSKIRI